VYTSDIWRHLQFDASPINRSTSRPVWFNYQSSDYYFQHLERTIMSNQNPIIKDTAVDTLNSAIESLQLLSTLLRNTAKLGLAKEDEQAGEKHLSTEEVAGLATNLDGVQSALEEGVAQVQTRGTAKDNKGEEE
jgi:hypothetical protein